MFANEHVNCRRGRAKCSLFIFFGLLLQCRAHSFYDNPEQYPLPSGPDADDELHRKWDHEVGKLHLLTRIIHEWFTKTFTVVGIFGNINLCTSEARQVLEPPGCPL